MCGIAGVVGIEDAAPALEAVQRMTRALARRGPDSEGVECWTGVVFGHRRLAIFDLSDAGRQPMLSPDRSLGVVFNGAIYNFRALTAELTAAGAQFRSRTDTEVLLHGYRRWGIDGLVARLRGMFAFALWDNANRTLYLVRDRLGVKPLVYAARNGGLAFASTVRALRAGGWAGDLDEAALTEFLEFGFVTDGRAIYQGVAKVPAASIVRWHDGALQVKEYWTPPAPPAERATGAPTFDEAVEETERLFLAAVERRLDADVPVGALLSGGLDSGLVCWAVTKLGADLTAFSVGTPGDPEDETADACATAAELGIRHRVVGLPTSGGPGIADLASAYGEPFGAPSALGMLRVCQEVKGSATVLLTGDGGDDLFLGYTRHRHLWLAQTIANVAPARASNWWRAVRRIFPPVGALRRVVHLLDYTTGGLGAFIAASDGLPTYHRKRLLGERLAGATVRQRQIPWSAESARHVLTDYLEYDRRTQFVAEYLTKVDGAAMHHALEARSPFLDQELWEFASALPPGIRLRGGRLKAVLRELARRRIGPRIAAGRKRGFSIPVGRWLAGRWLPQMEATLRSSRLAADGWVRPEGVVAEIAAARRRGHACHQLWYLFVLESWMRAEQASQTEPASAPHTHAASAVQGVGLAS
ncbi:MAG TPA: asparagine synthase (glutamine-hydrolyzing) [Gemmatimonadales bacterium]|nr:asparagine synthase (glutamine-hydrolyzing) [Gemmatimonadales bacterium]